MDEQHKIILQKRIAKAENLVKTGLFPLECSQIIGDAKDYRESSDYEDFVIIEREIAEEQIRSAERFLEITEKYLAGL